MSRSVSRRRTTRCVRSTRPWFDRTGQRARSFRRLLVERLEDRRLLSVYEFDHVLKELVLGLPDGSTERVLLSGTASMFVGHRRIGSGGGYGRRRTRPGADQARDPEPDRHQFAGAGARRVGLRRGRRSGEIEELANDDARDLGPAAVHGDDPGGQLLRRVPRDRDRRAGAAHGGSGAPDRRRSPTCRRRRARRTS